MSDTQSVAQLEKEIHKLRFKLQMAEGRVAPMQALLNKKNTYIEELEKKLKRLQAGPDWLKAKVANLKNTNTALRREIEELNRLAALPPASHMRYRAWCTRWMAKKQVELRAQMRALQASRETVDKSRGTIPPALWRDIMMCVHPDSTPSEETRNAAARGLIEREDVLRTNGGAS